MTPEAPMTDPAAPEIQPESAGPSRAAFYGVVAVAILLATAAVWAAFAAANNAREASDLRASGAKSLADAKADGDRREAAAEKAGIERAAKGFASAVAPFVALKGQVPEVSDRSFQSAVRNLLATGNYKFVAVTDASGTVLASSDLASVGRPLNAPSGAETATAPITGPSATDPKLGEVVLAVR